MSDFEKYIKEQDKKYIESDTNYVNNTYITEDEIRVLREIKTFFGENDSNVFSHVAYAVLDRVIKKIS